MYVVIIKIKKLLIISNNIIFENATYNIAHRDNMIE